MCHQTCLKGGGTSSHAAFFQLGSVLLTLHRALKAVVKFHCETSLGFLTANNETVCYAPDYITQGSLPGDSDDVLIECLFRSTYVVVNAPKCEHLPPILSTGKTTPGKTAPPMASSIDTLYIGCF